jgi:type I restriction enzyme S subunit
VPLNCFVFHATRTFSQPTSKASRLPQTLVPVPPLPDQRRIVEYVDGLQAKVDRLKELQAATAAELDALLPSILDKAFKREL